MLYYLSTVQDAETGQRGYLLTGRPEYLESYRRAQSTLGSLTDVGSHRADSLARLKMDELGETVRLKRAGRDSAALAIVNTNVGKQFMDGFREEIARLQRIKQDEITASFTSLRQLDSGFLVMRLLSIGVLAYLLILLYSRLGPLINSLESANRQQQLEIERRRHTEERNQELIDRLTAKNLDLDHFAYIASHDLQEPLRTVHNFVEVLREEYGDRLDEQADTYFTFLFRATERMRDLISNLLNFSRIGAEGGRQAVNLDAVLDEVLETLSLRVRESGAVIERNASLPEITGFRIELFQLFQNLLTNALKFTRPGEPPRISVFCTETDQSYRIGIEDQGIGISEQDQAKIFRMFSRINMPADYAGDGIGLAFCRKIVDLHGGTLTVDSSPGHGSTFYISLPRTVDNEKTITHPPGR